MEMVTLREFWKSRKKRKERMSTIIIVAGIRLVVVVYDLWSKSSHELWISIEGMEEAESVAIRIPEMHIRKKDQMVEAIHDIIHTLRQGTNDNIRFVL